MSEPRYLPMGEPTSLKTDESFRSPNTFFAETMSLGNILSEACAAGNKELVVQLCKEGAEVNEANEKNQTTPLIAASRNGHTDVVEFLCGQIKSLDVRDSRGWTALEYAVRCGWFPVAEVLCRCGANVNMMTSSNLTVLHYAAVDGDKNMAKMLVSHGACVKTRTRKTPKKFAEWFGHKEVVKVLKTGVTKTSKDIMCLPWPKLFDKSKNQSKENIYLSSRDISQSQEGFSAHKVIHESSDTDQSKEGASFMVDSEKLDLSFPPKSVEQTGHVTDEKKTSNQSQNDNVGEHGNMKEHDSLSCSRGVIQDEATNISQAVCHGAEQAMLKSTTSRRGIGNGDVPESGENYQYKIPVESRSKDSEIAPYAWTCDHGHYISLENPYITPTEPQETYPSRSMPDPQVCGQKRRPPTPCRYRGRIHDPRMVIHNTVNNIFIGGDVGHTNSTSGTQNNVTKAENVVIDGNMNVVHPGERGVSPEMSDDSSSNYLTGSDRDINGSHHSLS